MNRRSHQAKGSRAPAALASVLGAALIACASASAQVPQLPQDPVGETLRQPAPQAVQDVVKGTPAQPAGEQISEVGRQLPGGSSGSPTPSTDTGTSGSARPSGAAASTPSRGGRTGAGRAPAGAGDAAGGGSEGRSGAAAADDAPPLRDAALTPSRRAAARVTRPSQDGGVGRTIRDVVEVVPTAIWIALGALALISLGLLARTLVERRRARRLEREREQLRQDVGLLESALLPSVAERIGPLCASAAHRSASGPAAGGDFYDAFELVDGRAAVIVGDASGHGREALERTRSICSTLRAYLDAGLEPRAALEVADRALPADDSGNFATVVVAVHGGDALTYAAAGHPPPIVTGPAGEPVAAASSPPLGIGVRTGLRQTTVPFPRGSLACFFTDGLLEARGSEGMIGRQRLAEIVAALGPEEGANALLERVGAEAETPDDMAACTLRALEGGDRIAPRVEELELDAASLKTDTPERFLQDCGLAPEAVASALAEARSTAARVGGALLRVTIAGSEPAVSVDPAGSRHEPLLASDAGSLLLADSS